MRRSLVALVSHLGALLLALSARDARAAGAPRPRAIVVLDDGERVSSDTSHPLPPSPWPEEVRLFALGEETVAFQVVLDAGPLPISDVSVSLSPLQGDGGALGARVSTFAEVFVDVKRATGNAKDPDDALHATKEAAPSTSGPSSFVGPFADALVPGRPVSANRNERAAIWVDVDVPKGARAGTYRSTLLVTDADTQYARRDVVVEVIGRDLPYPGADITTFYEPDTLRKRMISGGADGGAPMATIETSLRQLLHAHRVSAFHEVTAAPIPRIDDDALTGALYTEARGYHGAGAGRGEGIFVLGAYGELGPPEPAKVAVVRSVAKHLRELGVFDRTATFVYAADESCKSPIPGAWMNALKDVNEARGVRVGATCDKDPREHPADLVIATPEGFDPKLAAEARARGKWTWAYNGRLPFGGPMMLDLPATELRANAWIAARYDVDRWFYWESTFWLDGNKGGRGGGPGFDPFTVAETFHNQDGDWANGDGILVYPGTQRPSGMRDDAKSEVFPSIRLKNLRRGAEDMGYFSLALAVDAKRANDVVARMIPSALAGAKGRAAWTDDGVAWIRARHDLLEVFAPGAATGTVPPASPDAGAADGRGGSGASRKRGCGSCAIGAEARGEPNAATVGWWFAAPIVLATAAARRRRRARSLGIPASPRMSP